VIQPDGSTCLYNIPFVYAAIVKTGTRALYNNLYAGLRLQLSACCHASYMF